MSKFLKRHRIVAPTSKMTLLLTQSTYFSVKTGDIFAIQDRWKLEPAKSSKDLALLLDTKDKLLSLNKRLWNSSE
jgi:hypothetical protein